MDDLKRSADGATTGSAGDAAQLPEARQTARRSGAEAIIRPSDVVAISEQWQAARRALVIAQPDISKQLADAVKLRTAFSLPHSNAGLIANTLRALDIDVKSRLVGPGLAESLANVFRTRNQLGGLVEHWTNLRGVQLTAAEVLSTGYFAQTAELSKVLGGVAASVLAQLPTQHLLDSTTRRMWDTWGAAAGAVAGTSTSAAPVVTATRGVITSTAAAGMLVGYEPIAEVSDGVDAVEADWCAASNDVRRDTLIALRRLHPALPGKLQGASAVLGSSSPDRLSQAANSLIEVIDRSLGLLAPEADVCAWHKANGRPAGELTAQGRPTKGLQVRYALRNNPKLARAIDAQVQVVVTIRETLQGSKHELEFDDEALMRTLLVSTESILATILL